MTFTPDNWNEAQTVTVEATHDADVLNGSATIQHSVSGSDYGRHDVTAREVRVSIRDDDERKVTVSDALLTIREGHSGQYSVRLESAPTDTVTITSSVTGDSDVTVSPSTLTFSADNWNVPQKITVSTADDADAADDSATVEHLVDGGDYGEFGVTAIPVSVRVTDDEVESTNIVLSVSPQEISESDAATALQVTGTLNGGAFTDDTTVALSISADTATESTDYTAGTSTLTIPAGQLSATATLTLTPVSDDIDESDETVLVDGEVSGLTVTPASVTIADDDTRGVVVSPTTLDIDEGHSKQYTVALQSAPTGTVTIAISVPADADANPSPQSLTFTADNWNQTQTVTVSTEHDDDVTDDVVTVKHSVSGGDYGQHAVTADDVRIEIDDDDSAVKRVTLSVVPNGVSESAGATQLTVTGSLNGGARSQDTVVSLSMSGGTAAASDFTATSATLTIAAGNTSATAHLTFTPTDDSLVEGDETAHIVGSASGLQVTRTSVTILDDDETLRVSVSPTSLSFQEGGSSFYTVALTTSPTAAVTISMSAIGDSDISVSQRTLTFTADNWREPQRVVVRSTHDNDTTNDRATINHSVSGGNYGSQGVTADSVAVLVYDDDDPSTKVVLSVTPNEVSESAGTTTLSVRGVLDGGTLTQDTTVSLSVNAGTADESTDYTSGSATLTIRAGRTGGAATLTLTPIDDDIDERDETVLVVGQTANLEVDAASITIVDNDQRGVVVEPTVLVIHEGGQQAYSVALLSAPTETVTIDISVSGDSDITTTVPSLSFTASDWNTEKTVTVNAAQDADATEDTATIRHVVTGGDYGSSQRHRRFRRRIGRRRRRRNNGCHSFRRTDADWRVCRCDSCLRDRNPQRRSTRSGNHRCSVSERWDGHRIGRLCSDLGLPHNPAGADQWHSPADGHSGCRRC